MVFPAQEFSHPEGVTSMSMPPDINPTNLRSQRRASRRLAAANLPAVYRLDVFGSDVVDVVRSAGGWLFDHVMAGWHINVDVGTVADARPLQILGVRESALHDVTTQELPAIIALTSHILDDDSDVRARVAAALRRGGDDVIVWGDPGRTERNYQFDNRQYQPSTAARMFKTHALIAAGVSGEALDTVERFRASVGLRAEKRLPVGLRHRSTINGTA
jgi:hypothetical protein